MGSVAESNVSRLTQSAIMELIMAGHQAYHYPNSDQYDLPGDLSDVVIS